MAPDKPNVKKSQKPKQAQKSNQKQTLKNKVCKQSLSPYKALEV